MAPRSRRDPLDPAIEAALLPGRFVRWDATFGFVSGLEEATRGIESLLHPDPARAVSLCETFLAGCYEKAEEIDDSGGDFGGFVSDLHGLWIRAREAAGADVGETVERILRWMDEDPYGYCHHLERKAVPALGEEGLAAFERAVLARLEAGAHAAAEPVGPEERRRDYHLLRQGEILRKVYAKRRDLEAFIALCERTGVSPVDGLSIARELKARRRPEEALRWVERGLALDAGTRFGSSAKYDLESLRLVLLRRVGRGAEAVETAWAAYREHPCSARYEELMRTGPKAERSSWHAKAMEEIATGGGLESVLDLLVETKETERLARRVEAASDRDLEGLSHFAMEPVARRLAKQNAALAAKVYRALGMRILNEKKSRYYDEALVHFENAMRCYRRAGLGLAWETVVTEVRETHGRKHAFMPGFERLLAGQGPSREPSFLERARGRWLPGGQGVDGGEEA